MFEGCIVGRSGGASSAMTNDEIADVLKMYAQLYELHGGNPFKIKSYNSAVFRIDKYPVLLSGKNEEELANLD